MSKYEYKQKQKGAALVELAVVLPILLILVFGMVELGRALHQYNSLGKATEVGARYMSRVWGGLDSDCQQQDNWADAIDTARNLVVFGNEFGSGDSILPGLSTDQVVIQVIASSVPGLSQTVCIVRLEASFDFQSVFGERVVPFLDLGPISLSAEREMRYIGE